MLTLSPLGVDDLIKEFCLNEISKENEICQHLKESPQSCMSLNCPLNLFRSHLMAKAMDELDEF